MKLFTDNKGQIRVIEAFFASLLMLSVFALIPSEMNTGNSDDLAIRMTSQNVFASMNSDGYLSRLIEAEDWASLRKYVESIVPPTLWFNLTVFNENMTCMNEILICSGGQISERIVATDYICASIGRNYKIYVVRLQLSAVN